MKEFARDIYGGFRVFGRERIFAASVTATLALGIGTTVAMFSVLNATVLRPLPYSHPSELVILTTHNLLQNTGDGSSLPNVYDWRRQSRLFAGMAVHRRTSVSRVNYAGVDAPQRAQEGLVGPEFFALLGTPPLIGRTFTREEFDRHERVVVLSEGLWQERFARSASALGRTLPIGGADHIIIGVMPQSFRLPTADTRFWRPLSVLDAYWERSQIMRGSDGFEVIGRLAPDVRIEDARAEMSLIARRLREEHPSNRHLDVRVVSLFDHVVGAHTRRGMWLAFGAVLSLLAISCANAGGLLIARAARRRRELSVRAALGAGRARLVRQLLAESVSVWAAASLFGLFIAYVLTGLWLAYGPQALPRMEQVAIDAAGLAVAFLGGLAAVLACGTVPALVASKTDAGAAFTTRDDASLPRHRLQDALVTAQIGGALMLTIGAVLFAQSFFRVQREDAGYSPASLLIVRIDGPSSPNFFREAKDRIGRLPGVAAVGGITDFFHRRNPDQRVTIEGRAADQDRLPKLAIDSVTPGYFRSMGIELIEGREFDDRDVERDAPLVCVINETMARWYWPAESAVGKRMVGGESPPADGRWYTVVGVVSDIRRDSLDVAPIGAAFIPRYLQTMDMTIRAFGDVEALIPAIRREIRSIDPLLPMPSISTADARLSERISGRRLQTQLLVGFAAAALLLSAAGLYALLAYQVALRTREIGIRSALGAPERTIVRMFVGRGLRVALPGTVAGVVGAAACGRVMQSLLYDTAAIDARSYSLAVASVLFVAAMAAWVPARRASRVNPLTALRYE